MKSRGILYARCSDMSQEDSVAQQIKWAIARARELGVQLNVTEDDLRRYRDAGGQLPNIGDFYCDEGVSGGDLQRPGWRAFVDRVVKDRDISHCFAYDRSRLARPEEPEDATRVEKAIRNAGKTIVFASGPPLGPRRIAGGGGIEEIISVLEYGQAGQFRADLAKRTLRGADENVKMGYWCGGRAPYGFRRALFSIAERRVVRLIDDGEIIRSAGHGIVIVPDDSIEGRDRLAVVREICAAYHSRVRGIHAIANELNQRGVPSPDNGRSRKSRKGKAYQVPGKWTAGTVRNVIENPIYAGFVSYGRRAFGVLARYSKDAAAGSREVENEERKSGSNRAIIHEHRNPDDYYYGPPAAFFPPIITEAVWRENLLRLKQAGEKGGLRGRVKCPDPGKYPLTVICGDCGHTMAGCPGPNGRNTYRCARHINSGNMECHPNRVEVEALVAFVVAVLRDHLKQHGTKDVIKSRLKHLLAARADGLTQTEAQLVELRARRDTLYEQVKAATRMVLDASSNTAKAAMQEVHDERSRDLSQVELRLLDLQERQRFHGKHTDSDLDVTMGFIDRLDRFLARADRKALRVLFEGLGVSLVVRFAANDGRAHKNRERVPVGATLCLGTHGASMRVPTEAVTADGATQKTDSPGPFGGPGVSDSSTEDGRGDRI